MEEENRVALTGFREMDPEPADIDVAMRDTGILRRRSRAHWAQSRNVWGIL
jgi:hypothetical protein